MDKPIHVLILDNSYTFGGAINSLCYLLRALDKERFIPIVVTGQPREYMSKNFACAWYHFVPKLPWVNNRIYCKLIGLPVFRIRIFRTVLNLLRYVYWLIFINIPEVLIYVKLAHKHNVDIIHLNNILSSQLSGILAAKLLSIPCVAHLRAFETVRPIARFYAGMIDHHVAISNAIRNNLLQLGVPSQRITLVSDAIDLREFNMDVDDTYLFEEFSLSADQPRYGIFGRIVEWKGIREFIHAARLVMEEVPDAIPFVVGGSSDGDKNFMDEMARLAVDLGLKNRLIFTGYRQDIPALMKFMDIVVHASNNPEPFGMVLIEGMAMYKPIIATCGGGPNDIIVEGENGFIVESFDCVNMAKKIVELLKDPDKARVMGSKANSLVLQKFTKERYAKEVEMVYRNVLSAKR